MVLQLFATIFLLSDTNFEKMNIGKKLFKIWKRWLDFLPVWKFNKYISDSYLFFKETFRIWFDIQLDS